jgi:hypothetical protein
MVTRTTAISMSGILNVVNVGDRFVQVKNLNLVAIIQWFVLVNELMFSVVLVGTNLLVSVNSTINQRFSFSFSILLTLLFICLFDFWTEIEIFKSIIICRCCMGWFLFSWFRESHMAFFGMFSFRRFVWFHSKSVYLFFLIGDDVDSNECELTTKYSLCTICSICKCHFYRIIELLTSHKHKTQQF